SSDLEPFAAIYAKAAADGWAGLFCERDDRPTMASPPLTKILEAALLAAGEPLPLERLQELFPEAERPSRAELRQALAELAEQLAGRSIELKEVASGYRLQVRREFSPWVSRLWEERTTRYSRALLE